MEIVMRLLHMKNVYMILNYVQLEVLLQLIMQFWLIVLIQFKIELSKKH